MAAPTPYDRATSFRLFSAQNPTQQQSGTSLDQEFDAIKVAMDETQGNLALIQNADGRLANASVGRVQLGLIEIDLIEQPDGTLLRMTHSGLPDAEQCANHADGWAHYLGRLAPVAAGRPAEPDPWNATD